MFSVCALFYGNYPDLAIRLLNSLKKAEYVQDFRLGLNQVSQETREYIESWALQALHKCPVYFYESSDNKNLGKYPLMRQMFRDKTVAKKIMWFDDDSYLDAAAGGDWWRAVKQASSTHIQLGAVHRIIQRGQQYLQIPLQPWFTNKAVNARHRFEFATGGWWVADSSFLLKWDYPFLALHHNGGDSILGELLRQQGHRPYNFLTACQCHCESCAAQPRKQNTPVVHINVGGRRGRRGLGVTDENYVWSSNNFNLAHQVFDLKITRYVNFAANT